MSVWDRSRDSTHRIFFLKHKMRPLTCKNQFRNQFLQVKNPILTWFFKNQVQMDRLTGSSNFDYFNHNRERWFNKDEKFWDFYARIFQASYFVYRWCERCIAKWIEIFSERLIIFKHLQLHLQVYETFYM